MGVVYPQALQPNLWCCWLSDDFVQFIVSIVHNLCLYYATKEDQNWQRETGYDIQTQSGKTRFCVISSPGGPLLVGDHFLCKVTTWLLWEFQVWRWWSVCVVYASLWYIQLWVTTALWSPWKPGARHLAISWHVLTQMGALCSTVTCWNLLVPRQKHAFS